MENEKKIKIRMCVVCRKRDKQENLYRLQCKSGVLIPFSGRGRSFYVCENCINTKKFIKYLSKLCNLDKDKIKESLFHFPFYTKEKEFI
jgi:predicted RNA-binding protein YlxR (DUF448 family)